MQLPAERGRSIPLEIVEEILLNLPVKSLVRFSTVSKSWTTLISDEKFISRHKRLASLSGREWILISHSRVGSLIPATTRPLSSLSPTTRLDRLACPLEDQRFVKLIISCNDMWCVENPVALFLWNPSMGTFKKLPPPLFESLGCHEFSFGMGFDTLADDYKIVKIPELFRSFSSGAELYSLRSNSWRKIQRFPLSYNPCSKGVFVGNALHWMTKPPFGAAIISFDLSTEKYAEVAQPRAVEDLALLNKVVVDLAVLRGKLCIHLNNHTSKRFVLWEMQEYGDEKSWRKMLEIDVWSVVVPITLGRGKIVLTPLYLYHDGMILIKATTSEYALIFKYKDEVAPEIICRSYDCECTSGALYIESLVSPAAY